MINGVGGSIGGEGYASQGRTEPVMQFAAQPPALLFACCDNAFSRCLKLFLHHSRVHSDSDGIGQHGKRSAIGRGELALTSMQSEHQLPL